MKAKVENASAELRVFGQDVAKVLSALKSRDHCNGFLMGGIYEGPEVHCPVSRNAGL